MVRKLGSENKEFIWNLDETLESNLKSLDMFTMKSEQLQWDSNTR